MFRRLFTIVLPFIQYLIKKNFWLLIKQETSRNKVFEDRMTLSLTAAPRFKFLLFTLQVNVVSNMQCIDMGIMYYFESALDSACSVNSSWNNWYLAGKYSFPLYRLIYIILFFLLPGYSEGEKGGGEEETRGGGKGGAGGEFIYLYNPQVSYH